MSTQKKVFLKGEGNAWYGRNKETLSERHLPDGDIVLTELVNLFSDFSKLKILEIGCGSGERLSWLKLQGADVFGIDPSSDAIDAVIDKGISAKIGTADNLPYEENTFDIVIVGFCLYLCDRQDLFLISSEINRVLKSTSWLIILDFYNKNHTSNSYAHLEGVYSFKMDYSSMFTWHPDYFLMLQKIVDHSDFKNLTDLENDMMCFQLLRKNE